jgi:hypothetical protein
MKNKKLNFQDFIRQIGWNVADYEKTNKEFKQKIAESPIWNLDHEIKWLSDDAVMASIFLREHTDLLEGIEMLTKKYPDDDSFQKIYDRMEEHLKSRIRDFNRTLKHMSIMNSSSMFHNAVGFYEYKAKSKLVEIFEYYIEILNWERKE